MIFGKLAGKANRALDMNNADAAAEWRKILGREMNVLIQSSPTHRTLVAMVGVLPL